MADPSNVDNDPWALPELKDHGVKWSELDGKSKVKRVTTLLVKITLLIGLLYLFICSLSFLSSAFRLLGGRAAGRAFSENEILSNPIAGLMIGVLVTVLVQSSSTSTSIVVAMVAGDVLKVKNAIYIIMGANIGTTVTNTLVSLGQVIDRDQFRRAFAAATVHDMFNFVTVLLFLPLEVITGYLFALTDAIITSLNLKTQENLKQDYLKKITNPFTKKIIELDKKLIEKIAKAKTEAERSKLEESSMIKQFCEDSKHNVTYLVNVTEGNGFRTESRTKIVDVKDIPCDFLFHGTSLSDSAVGAILLVVSIIILCICLISIVKLLHSMFKGRMAVLTRKVVNTDFPKPFGFLSGYLAIVFGAVLTFLVQSSSIFTSAVTPLVGVGVITIDRMYPLTLGSNIGTTTTSLLASFAADSSKLRYTLQIALCHLFFNISGILVWYPIPFMRKFPLKMAKSLGFVTSKYRWFSIAYIIMVFFLIPAMVFGLSLAGTYVFIGIAVPVALLIIFIIVVNILQSKRRGVLPHKLQSWEWIPIWLRSLEPYDKIIGKAYGTISCGKGEKPSSPMNSNVKGGIQNSAYQGSSSKSHELEEKDVERGSGKSNEGFADTVTDRL